MHRIHCQWCLTEFDARRIDARFCSPTCRRESLDARKRRRFWAELGRIGRSRPARKPL